MKIKSNSNDVNLEVINFEILNEISFSHVIFNKIWKKISEKHITTTLGILLKQCM
jgi:hypothetical protein